MLIPSPESAYDVCKDFMPECSRPLDDLDAASSSSAIKRQLPLSVTGPGGSSTDNLVYAQAPNGSFVVNKIFKIC